MSAPETSGSADPQWICMVTLFIASLVTLLVYLVQYFQQGSGQRGAEVAAEQQEAAALLGWALSLSSWRSQWRGAWCRALEEQARKQEGDVVFSFQEDDLETTELKVHHVSSFHKSPRKKAAVCTVVAESLHFSVTASSLSSASSAPAQSCRFTACVAPLQLQLHLLVRDAEEEVELNWEVSQLEAEQLQVKPLVNQDGGGPGSAAALAEQLRRLLCATSPSVLLGCRPAQPSEVQEVLSKVVSPPKPPRAHEWKLLVKNIRAAVHQEQAAGSVNPVCVLQLDDPPQKFSTCVQKSTTSPYWEQPFIFELNGQSRELNIQVMDEGQAPETSLIGLVSVPFDLVKKQPEGRHTFALMTKNSVTGSLTTEFTYLDPSEVRSWHPPTPASNKRVEMDRTVMPCGTVVTTITAVKSKPGRPPPLHLDSSPKAGHSRPLSRPKLSERRVSEQGSAPGSAPGAPVSKALSSSDTELLMLNGADPVAEAAIRQLHQSAKQKLKSPVKKSTIIISGIAKTPLSQDDELALMAGYAAAMDASMSVSSSTQDVTAATATGGSSIQEESQLQEGSGRPPDDWESQTGEELDHSSLSMCVSEASCKKSRGSFLQKSAKLFFRRRHQRKDPGMSQSHNDLAYMESPAAVERASRTATLSRMLHRRSRNKSKANGSTMEPHV